MNKGDWIVEWRDLESGLEKCKCPFCEHIEYFFNYRRANFCEICGAQLRENLISREEFDSE